MTTTKIKLLSNNKDRAETAGSGNPLHWFIQQQFDILEYDPACTYNPADTVVIIPGMAQDPWWKPFYEKGFKLVIDNVREAAEVIPRQYWRSEPGDIVQAANPVPPGAFVLNSSDFFMISESERRRTIGHNLYQPQRSYQYKALIPMNRVKPHRSLLLEKLDSELDQCMWSYVQQGHVMPGDVVGPPAVWEPYINLDWYDQCCFSVIGESMIEPYFNWIEFWRQQPLAPRPPFITEKTWKAVAMQHPFMVLGEIGTLEHMRSLGFETFENLWDESYDTMPDLSDRVAKIVHNVVQYVKQPLDQITLQKIQHNHARFFDQTWILQLTMDQIIKPIYDYAESR